MSNGKTGTPLGGTELILANLKKALPELTSQVQIMMSRPEQYELENKPRILWLQDLPGDPASAVLRDKSYRGRFNRIVFCSNWQQQQYAIYLKIPYREGVVVKNGVPRLEPAFPKPRPAGKLRFLYTSTPHRGLGILAAAAGQLARERQDWELHVYSSLNIYGWHEEDEKFKPLYDLLRANPCVVYHGTQPNDVVRQACVDAHVFCYPSIYQETSCMAIQEAMMAGCLAITTNLGALIETCGEFAWMLPYTEQPEQLAQSTYAAMKNSFAACNDSRVEMMLRMQTGYFQMYYDFAARVPRWEQLLKQVIAEGPPPPVEKPAAG